LLQALGLPRVSLVGHSMGGAMALAFAARWPEAVERLVLVAPAVDLPHRSVLANIVPPLMAAGRVQPRFYPTLVWDSMRAGPWTLFRTARNLFEMEVASDGVHCPTLLVWGEHDALVPVMHIIANAGHVVMFDRAAEFNDVVLRFL
jgi:pimeloyl-ACP methyl ester carboxylesterase